MAIPHAVLAAGWVPFVVVLVLTLLFSFVYVRYFQSRYESELSSTLVAIFGLAVSLLTVALVPIDIFLVGYMKTPDGNFQPWAQNKTDRDSLTNSVLYAYYALYTCELLFVVVLLPFTYFYYEEGDEDRTTKSRVCSAVKYTTAFVFVAAVLMVVGVFAPLRHQPNINGTEWDHFKNIIDELKSTGLEDSLSFTISSLTLVGMLLLIVYTGYGVSAWPMDLVKGRRSAAKEHADVVEERSKAEAQINAIRSKYASGRRPMSRGDQHRVEDLEEQVGLMLRREGALEATERSCLRKCLVVFRPFQIVFGILLLLVTLLMFLSLLLTNIDKLMHSLGPRMGYALPERKLPNPIDIILVFSQKVFPMDYILLGGLVLFLLFSSMGGLQHIGVWFCWIRMYKIRPRRTKPQGLLMFIFLLIFIVLAMNVLLFQLTPQYSMYGNQHYLSSQNGTNQTRQVLMPCKSSSPPDTCVMSRMSLLLVRFFYKAWFFGAGYFWASWVFLAVMVIGFIVVLVRKRRSSVEGAVDRDDIEDEDIIEA